MHNIISMLGKAFTFRALKRQLNIQLFKMFLTLLWTREKVINRNKEQNIIFHCEWELLCQGEG